MLFASSQLLKHKVKTHFRKEILATEVFQKLPRFEKRHHIVCVLKNNEQLICTRNAFLYHQQPNPDTLNHSYHFPHPSALGVLFISPAASDHPCPCPCCSFCQKPSLPRCLPGWLLSTLWSQLDFILNTSLIVLP